MSFRIYEPKIREAISTRALPKIPHAPPPLRVADLGNMTYRLHSRGYAAAPASPALCSKLGPVLIATFPSRRVVSEILTNERRFGQL